MREVINQIILILWMAMFTVWFITALKLNSAIAV